MSVIDTNVLVHATDPLSVNRLRARGAIKRLAAQGGLAVTRQILREYLVVMTRHQPTRAAYTLADAFAAASRVIRYADILEDGPNVWVELQNLSRRFSFGGKQIHDTNIVATMLAHGETRVLTFNVIDFRRFHPLIEIIEP